MSNYENTRQPQNPSSFPSMYSFPQQVLKGRREGVYGFLTSKNWPLAMIQYFEKALHHIAIRYFLCDDSGSMYINDGTLVHPHCG